MDEILGASPQLDVAFVMNKMIYNDIHWINAIPLLMCPEQKRRCLLQMFFWCLVEHVV